MGAEHDFPAKHSDVLEQSLPYKVPPNFFGALATFNGSVIADRTRGTLTAYGASEAENILSLNLARKIVREELVPLEMEYLASDRHAYGLPPTTNIRCPTTPANCSRRCSSWRRTRSRTTRSNAALPSSRLGR